MVNLFGEGGTGYHTDLNPAITAEFAHAVYRFGHSMLTETVDRTTPDGTEPNMDLLDAFLNPPAFFGRRDATPSSAAGNIVRGMTRQVGNELDEFVTEAAAQPPARPAARPGGAEHRPRPRHRHPDAQRRPPGVLRSSGDTSLAPYTSWIDFGFNLRHEESLINFIAAYGTHQHHRPRDRHARRRKRAAAQALDRRRPTAIRSRRRAPQDALDFLESTGIWAERRRRRHHHRCRRHRPVGRRPRREADRRSAACSARRSTTSSRSRWRTCRTATGSTTCPAPPA